MVSQSCKVSSRAKLLAKFIYIGSLAVSLQNLHAERGNCWLESKVGYQEQYRAGETQPREEERLASKPNSIT